MGNDIIRNAAKTGRRRQIPMGFEWWRIAPGNLPGNERFGMSDMLLPHSEDLFR
jgi:hypothetical protein